MSAVLNLWAIDGLAILYANVKHLRPDEWKVLDINEQIGLHYPLIDSFLITLIAEIFLFIHCWIDHFKYFKPITNKVEHFAHHFIYENYDACRIFPGL